MKFWKPILTTQRSFGSRSLTTKVKYNIGAKILIFYCFFTTESFPFWISMIFSAVSTDFRGASFELGPRAVATTLIKKKCVLQPENTKNLDFSRRRQNKLKLIQKYMDFCRRRQNKGEENTKNMDFCRRRQNKGEENAKNMDFYRRRQNKGEENAKNMDFCRRRQNKLKLLRLRNR